MYYSKNKGPNQGCIILSDKLYIFLPHLMQGIIFPHTQVHNFPTEVDIPEVVYLGIPYSVNFSRHIIFVAFMDRLPSMKM